MPPILTSIEIARPQAEVFSYVVDPATFAEWQAGVAGGCTNGRVGRGATCTTRRRIGLSERSVTSEVTDFDPPRRCAVRGVDGPIRAIVDVTVEPIGSASCRVTIEVDFEGHGLGRLLVPLVVRRQARNEMPSNCRRLRQRLESKSSGVGPVESQPSR